MNDNDPVFIEMQQEDKPLSFVAEIAVSALGVCGFVLIVAVLFTS